MPNKTFLISNQKSYTEDQFCKLNEESNLTVDHILTVNTLDLPYGCTEEEVLEEIDNVVKNINVTVKRPSWWPINPT